MIDYFHYDIRKKSNTFLNTSYEIYAEDGLLYEVNFGWTTNLAMMIYMPSKKYILKAKRYYTFLSFGYKILEENMQLGKLEFSRIAKTLKYRDVDNQFIVIHRIKRNEYNLLSNEGEIGKALRIKRNAFQLVVEQSQDQALIILLFVILERFRKYKASNG